MTLALYTEIVDALTYAIHSAAAKRNPNYVRTTIETRDAFVNMWPDHRDAYVPIGDRE